MRVFAIGDLHLEGGSGKSMEKFGDHWRQHDQKIFDNWNRIGREDDLLLLVGDLSWAMRLSEAIGDLNRIGQMKGRKLILKGNHDYWWQSLTKLQAALPPSIETLQASSLIINRVAIAGTRGWVCPNDPYFQPPDQKIYEREVGRLQTALTALQGRKNEYDVLIVALHYPPTNYTHEDSGFTRLIDEYDADFCVYGHLHGDAIKTGLTGIHRKAWYYLVSADSANFCPVEIPIQTAEKFS